MSFTKNKTELNKIGFSITPGIYNKDEISKIIHSIENIKSDSQSVIKTKELFAIRQLLIIKPDLWRILTNKNLKSLINEIGDSNYFLTKAIYFDKPKQSNWFVSYHQDLSINIIGRTKIDGYFNWTKKREQIGVQPPIEILENIFTIRIHLDDTDENNGALRIIPKSHLKGIIRIESKNFETKGEVICKVKKGECMLMKPLILHASSRSKNEKQRRIIHLEFSNKKLATPLKWKESKSINLI